MTMYLGLSAFTSSPISLLATTKASVFSFIPLASQSFWHPSRPLFSYTDWEISFRWMRWAS